MGRAVVSGLGVVSALGNDADTFFHAWLKEFQELQRNPFPF